MTLTTGGKGAFEVSVDGSLVHSKLQSGRIPTPDRLLEILRG